MSWDGAHFCLDDGQGQRDDCAEAAHHAQKLRDLLSGHAEFFGEADVRDLVENVHTDGWGLPKQGFRTVCPCCISRQQVEHDVAVDENAGFTPAHSPRPG